MKKQKPKKMQPLFNREKTIDTLIRDPKKFTELKKIMDKAYDVTERMQASKDLLGWQAYVVTLVPEFSKKQEFLTKLDELVNEYYNESERSDSTKSS